MMGEHTSQTQGHFVGGVWALLVKHVCAVSRAADGATAGGQVIE